MDAALKAYGFRVALRGYAVIVFVLSAPALYFIKPRLPPTRVRRFDFSFLLKPDFLIFELANIVQSAGYFLPAIYLPTYARMLGASAITASSTLVALNLACVVGYIGVGRVVDKFHVTGKCRKALLKQFTLIALRYVPRGYSQFYEDRLTDDLTSAHGRNRHSLNRVDFIAMGSHHRLACPFRLRSILRPSCWWLPKLMVRYDPSGGQEDGSGATDARSRVLGCWARHWQCHLWSNQ